MDGGGHSLRKVFQGSAFCEAQVSNGHAKCWTNPKGCTEDGLVRAGSGAKQEEFMEEENA